MTRTSSPSVRPGWTLAITSIASLMVALDMLVVTAALSTIQRDLGASMEQLEWTVNAYGLAFAALMMASSTLGDRLGRKTVFVGGIGLFGLASVACALSSSATSLVGSRVVQGAAAAAVMPQSMALLGAAFPGAARSKALGIFSGVTGLAVLGGPVVGGAIAGGLAWPWIFWINIPIAAALIALALIRIDEVHGAPGRMDLLGTVLLTLGVLGVTWALMRGNGQGWASSEVLWSGLLGLVALAAFTIWQFKFSAPMLPMRLFRDSKFANGNVAGFFLYGALYSAVFLLPQFLQVVLGWGPLETGVRLLPWTGTLFVVAPVAGRWVARVGERRILSLGLLLQGLGIGWVAITASPTLNYVPFAVALAIAGFGVSIAMPAAQTAVLSAVQPVEMGKASGVFNTLRQLGGVVGIALLVAVFLAHGNADTAARFASGFNRALMVSALLSLAGAAVALRLPSRQQLQQRAGTQDSAASKS